MSKREFRITDASRGAALPIRIIPHASHTRLLEIEDDGTLRLQLSSPPRPGGENELLIGYLAALFEVEPDEVQVVAGIDSNKKVVAVFNANATEIDRLIRQSLADED
jgi:uncharacterized protein YggU (UPF0235/DUF167 family)